ncbi:MAG TPA: AIM24 family protein [Mycobacteriales bacterium]|nr:AIM24 family protein [Mycobacteriales bacterium]
MITNKISGNAVQSVLCQLTPGQTVYAEPGKFLWKTQNVSLETRLSAPAGNQAGAPAAKAGLLGKALDVGKRVLAGERLAFEYFTTMGGNGLVSFAGVIPGEMRILELEPGTGWMTEHGAFVAAESTVGFDIAFTGLRAGLRGGEGFVLEHFTGPGTVVIAAAGNFIDLNPAKYGGTIQVHTGCIVGFQDTLSYSVERIGGLGTQTAMNAVFGDGATVATLTGDGQVLIQSFTIQALARTLEGHMRGQGEERKSGLGNLGGLGDLL